jgi:TolB-like protein/DNA-binding winged helix-turn-helix (wHTH) protein/tetratricopeptide (TPR) repeat protein
MTESGTTSFQFGPFVLLVRERALRNGVAAIPLTPKEFDTLYVLVREAGRLVTKDQIIGEVWPDSFVADGSLSRNISVLRKVLGDGFIQTVPKSGYRFIGAVKPLDEPTIQRTIATNDQFKGARQDGREAGEESLGPRNRPAHLIADVAAARPDSNYWVRYRSQKYAIWVSVVVLLAVMISTGAILLRRVTGSTKMAQPRFARLLVLPVQNLTGVTEQEYLTNGLTEELITRLGKIAPQSLGVIAQTTTMRLKYSPKSPEEIGSELNVEYVLASNLRHLEKRVRISVQLVRVADRAQMWAADYEREDQNLLGISNKIAVSIAPRLQLPSQEVIAPATEEGTKDNEAYEDYLRGRYFWNKRLKEEVSIARDYFSKAVARDPNYAKAYSGLADTYIVLAGSHMPASVAFGKAQEAAEKAIYLDDTQAEPHNSLAYVMYAENWDWAGADREYKRALTLDPQFAVSHHWYFIYLTSMKRFPEAISEAEKALEFDPLSQSINYNAAMTYILAGQDERGLRQLQKAIELDPNNPVPYGYLGLLYERQHKYDQAAQQFQKAEDFETEKATYLFDVAGAYAREGKISEARHLAEKLTAYSKTHYTNPYWFAAMYTGFGDQDKAIYWLDLAVHERSCTALEINTDSRLDFLRSDPRFHKLTSEMHLAVPVISRASE